MKNIVNRHYWHKFDTKLSKIIKDNPYSIFLACFRNPIERILSQYEFEWRWGCQNCNTKTDMTAYNYNELNEKNYNTHHKDASKKIMASQYSKYATIDFNDFLNRTIRFEINNQQMGKQWKPQKLRHMYINNYYTWAFCCDTRWCNVNNNIISDKNRFHKCLNDISNLIHSMDIILITEWLNDYRTQLFVNKLFVHDMDILNSDTWISMEKAKKPFPHSVTNKGRNYMISIETETLLHELNEMDLKVYNFIKNISYHNMISIWNKHNQNMPYNSINLGLSLNEML